MLERERERIQRSGLIERVQYDENNRPVKDPQTQEPDLTLEMCLIKNDQAAVLKLLNDSGGRDHYPPSRPAGAAPKKREYADFATLRGEMFWVDPDEARNSPRTLALKNMLNLIQWAWVDQIEGHRAAVNKHKEDLRTALRKDMSFIASAQHPQAATVSMAGTVMERPLPARPPAATVSTAGTVMERPLPARPRRDSFGDLMDLDQ